MFIPSLQYKEMVTVFAHVVLKIGWGYFVRVGVNVITSRWVNEMLIVFEYMRSVVSNSPWLVGYRAYRISSKQTPRLLFFFVACFCVLFEGGYYSRAAFTSLDINDGWIRMNEMVTIARRCQWYIRAASQSCCQPWKRPIQHE